jgi:formyl-CoA transferase
VRQLNPSIVFAQIKGFPSTGPNSRFLCLDMIAQSAGGSLATTGTASDQPLKPGPNLGDSGAGMHGTTGILAALYQREITGRGQRIEVSMQEAVINFNRRSFARYLATGTPPSRGSNVRMKEIFATKGGSPYDYCCIPLSQLSDDQWQRLLRVTGSINGAQLATSQDRVRYMGKIEMSLAAWCSRHTKVEAMDALQGAGVPAGAVLSTTDLSLDEDLRQCGMFATFEHPVRGTVTIPAWAVRMSESPVSVRSSPLLGQHTEEVLTEWLGQGKDEIRESNKAAPIAN